MLRCLWPLKQSNHPIQGSDEEAFEEARQEIIEEMLVHPGSCFGERELFFSRRDFVPQSLHKYYVAGREYKRLPLVARKRHQTATITSSKKAELMWMKWSDSAQPSFNQPTASFLDSKSDIPRSVLLWCDCSYGPTHKSLVRRKADLQLDRKDGQAARRG